MKKKFVLMALLCLSLLLTACSGDYNGTKGLDFEEKGAGYAISGYDGKEAKVVIPETYKGKKVVEIQGEAFSGNETVTDVTLPSSVEIIGSRAFSDNVNLEKVLLPKSVEVIEKEAFLNNEKLMLYSEAAGKPEGWSYKWKDSYNDVLWNSNLKDLQTWKSLANTEIAPENNLVQTEGIRLSSDYTAKAKKKPYTILYYINGRDPLSYIYSEELNNLMQVMAENPELSQTVNVVAEVASGSSFSQPELQENTNYRFTIDESGISNITDLGLRNAGDANTICDFINFGRASYPAKDTFLVLGGSGSGLENYFWMDQDFSEGGELTMTELRKALAGSAAEEKLSLLIMKADGCANAEWAYQMGSYAKALVAAPGRTQKTPSSEEWLSLLGSQSGMTLVQGIQAQLTEELALDTEKSPFAGIALGNLQKQLKWWNDNLMKLSDEELKASMDQVNELKDSSENYYDGYYTGAPVYMNLTSLSESGFSKLSGGLTDKGLQGLSIYMPRYFYEDESMPAYETFSKMDGYTKYLKALQQYEETGEAVSLSDIELGESAETGIYLNYGMEDIQSLYEVQFMRDEKYPDVLYVYGYDNGGKITADGQILEQLSTSTFKLKEELLCAIEQSSSEEIPHLYQIPVLINGEFDLMQITSEDQDIITALKNKKEPLSEKDEIIPLYPIVTTRSAKDAIFKSDAYYDGKYLKGEAIKLEGLPEGGIVQLGRKEYKNSERLFLLVDAQGQQQFSFTGLRNK